LMVCYDKLFYYVTRMCPPFVVALEVIRWDRGFVLGESIGRIALHTFVCWLIVRVSFFNGGLLFSSLTLSAITIILLYSFLLLVKAKFVVSGSFGGMSLSAVITTAAFLTDFRPERDPSWTMDALCYHNLTDRLCLRIYDIRPENLSMLLRAARRSSQSNISSSCNSSCSSWRLSEIWRSLR